MGEYESAEYGLFQKGWDYLVTGERQVSGSVLSLRDDSTFHYQTCGNILEGSWEVLADTLMLFIETNRWRSDSLNEFGFEGRQPKMGNQPDKFLISGRYLIQKVRVKNVDHVMVERLERID